jgi:hypothetical protein
MIDTLRLLWAAATVSDAAELVPYLLFGATSRERRLAPPAPGWLPPSRAVRLLLASMHSAVLIQYCMINGVVAAAPR